MRKIVFTVALLSSVLIVLKILFVFVPADDYSSPVFFLWFLAGLFLFVFGLYGWFAEWLFTKLRSSGKSQNLCLEASYFIQQRGFLMKILFFPFLKIKSTRPVIIALFGALAWIIIIMVLLQTFEKLFTR